MDTGNRWWCVGGALGTPLLALVLVLASPAPAAGQSPDCEDWTAPERRARRENPVSVNEKVLARGKELYLRECASCHGATGQNDGAGSKDTDMSCSVKHTDAALLARSDGELFWLIAEGRGSMPNTKDVMRDEERWMLVHYLRALAAGGSDHQEP